MIKLYTKQFVIGVVIFAVFIIYSLSIRHKIPAISKPLALTNNASSGGTSINTPSTSSNAPAPNVSSTSSGKYKDGNYTGSVADAYYGNVEVSVAVSGGKILAVKFLQYPDTHSTSVSINQQAMPYLQQEAIQAQSAKVQLISGATFTSQAYIQSLSSALSQATTQ